MVKIKRCIYALQRDGLPPITTHNVVDDWNDPVLSSVRRCQLFNTIHDRVKVRNQSLHMISQDSLSHDIFIIQVENNVF
jgi:hypothetical protein